MDSILLASSYPFKHFLLILTLTLSVFSVSCKSMVPSGHTTEKQAQLKAVEDSKFLLKLATHPTIDGHYHFEVCVSDRTGCVPALNFEEQSISFSAEDLRNAYQSQLNDASLVGEILPPASGALGGTGVAVSADLIVQRFTPNWAYFDALDEEVMDKLSLAGYETLGDVRKSIAAKKAVLKKYFPHEKLDLNLRTSLTIDHLEAVIKSDNFKAAYKTNGHIFSDEFTAFFKEASANNPNITDVARQLGSAKALKNNAIPWDKYLAAYRQKLGRKIDTNDLLAPGVANELRIFEDIKKLSSLSDTTSQKLMTRIGDFVAAGNRSFEFIKARSMVNLITVSDYLGQNYLRHVPDRMVISPAKRSQVLGAKIMKNKFVRSSGILALGVATGIVVGSFVEHHINPSDVFDPGVLVKYPSLAVPSGETSGKIDVETSKTLSVEALVSKLALMVESLDMPIDAYCMPDECTAL